MTRRHSLCSVIIKEVRWCCVQSLTGNRLAVVEIGRVVTVGTRTGRNGENGDDDAAISCSVVVRGA
jgi:hypothetical protein